MRNPRTERANPRTADIDKWSVADILAAMHEEDCQVPFAVGAVLPAIRQATELVVASLSGGGRVIYTGAGSSGRQAVLDASELVPTFGALGTRVAVLISGGKETMLTANEKAEDNAEAGRAAARENAVGITDTVIGIAASGHTPFVVGVMTEARALGAKTVAVVGAPGSIAALADVAICVDVGPEVVAGSTRLKNGTAQKLILNMISTAAMIALGRTYSNLMAGASSHNTKLSKRAIGILTAVTPVTEVTAERELAACGGQLDVALVSLVTQQGQAGARAALQAANGSIRQAIGIANGQGIEARTPVCRAERNLEAAFAVIEREVGDGEGLVPGAVAAVVRKGHILGLRSYGFAARAPERMPMQPSSIFDVASLTKVMATLPAVLLLVERGLARLDDPLALFMPMFGRGAKEKVTLRHLLTHSSGLPAHLHIWQLGLSPTAMIEYICDLPLEAPSRIGHEAVYSDLGYIMLGEFVRVVSGESLSEFARANIFQPLGMNDTGFLPPPDKQHRIAATEYRSDYGRYMWGEVHDENAYALGGVAGHAGLFSTAQDIAVYAAMWLNKGTYRGQAILSPQIVRVATAEHVGGPEPRGLGWLLPSRTHSSGGDLAPSHSFGHTGFTGTSLWCMPEHDTGIILLTNRVHAGRDRGNIHALRARFANAVLASISSAEGVRPSV